MNYKIIVSFKFEHFFSLYGYKNAVSLLPFERTHIKDVEIFARIELKELIEVKCQKNDLMFNENDKKYFYCIYDTDCTKFRFVGGDISIIMQVVDFVRKKFDGGEAEFFLLKTQRKIMLPDTQQLSIGLSFARREKTLNVVVSQSGHRTRMRKI